MTDNDKTTRILTKLQHKYTCLPERPYTALYSWWWVELSPETCRVKPLRRINATVASCWNYFTIVTYFAASIQFRAETYHSPKHNLIVMPRILALDYEVWSEWERRHVRHGSTLSWQTGSHLRRTAAEFTWFNDEISQVKSYILKLQHI